jgi:hypothetical protein
MGKTFDQLFLDRLSVIAGKLETEGVSTDDDDDEGADDALAPREFVALHRQHLEAFARIVDLLAHEYGLGDADQLPDERLTSLVDESIGYIETWSEAEIEDVPPYARTPLQRLLKEHHEIGEAICDLRDMDEP